MRYTIYENPITHRFAHLPLPSRFLDGDALPPIVVEKWFESYQAAVAALSELLARDTESGPIEEAAAHTTDVPQPIDLPPHRSFWFEH